MEVYSIPEMRRCSWFVYDNWTAEAQRGRQCLVVAFPTQRTKPHWPLLGGAVLCQGSIGRQEASNIFVSVPYLSQRWKLNVVQCHITGHFNVQIITCWNEPNLLYILIYGVTNLIYSLCEWESRVKSISPLGVRVVWVRYRSQSVRTKLVQQA